METDPKTLYRLWRVLAGRPRGFRVRTLTESSAPQLSRADIDAGLAANVVELRGEGIDGSYAWIGPREVPKPNKPELSAKPSQAFLPGHHLDVHRLCDPFPVMSDLQLIELADDIAAHGLREPIKLFEGKILDGRNRYTALLRCGKEIPYRVFDGTEAEAEATAYVMSKNVWRRHLTQEKKREMIATILKKEPTQSDRAIAEMMNVSHPTVAAVRREQEGTGKVLPVEKRTGRDGKTRRQPKKPDLATAHGSPERPSRTT